jgi:NAD(P)-dependent dehydrogenase (short-subunit alcohol dehydrogenase family)
MKTVLVTGAAKRIGAAIAHGLAQNGWNVCVHFNRSAEEAASLAKDLSRTGVKTAAIQADLSDPEALGGLIAICQERVGPLTGLINNASSFEYDNIESLNSEGFDHHLAVNLRAPILLARDFARALPQEAKGCIINLLDQKIQNLNPDFFSYTIAKIGLEGATRAMAMGLAPRVRVNAIAPGLTLLSADQTPENFANAQRRAPLGQTGNVADIVAATLFLLNTPSITGQTLFIDGGQRLVAMDRDVMFKTED